MRGSANWRYGWGAGGFRANSGFRLNSNLKPRRMCSLRSQLRRAIFQRASCFVQGQLRLYGGQAEALSLCGPPDALLECCDGSIFWWAAP